ncbi:PucR family transcriptional regulator [Paraconexibacter algicola]|uniref:PucR family transcriptional regulator n=1 Tax=Paraconexibacter algicola TaxID=2133960 RepID=A0A2T4UDK0_9ACTN|nr:helix-turn-helix domain-containing protein [Paraconexibacter algicola]PTL55586.1 hypothetical protein C7Y72_18260 [Paraconexibacter algicola]
MLRGMVEAELQDVVRARIAEVAGRIDSARMGEDMAAQLMATIPEFLPATDPDFRAGLVMSCTANLVAIQESLVGGVPMQPTTTEAPDDARAWAHELVHRGMPLASLLRAYRLGHSLFEREFEQRAAELELEPEVAWRVLADAGRELFIYIDAVCTQLVDDYENEREQWLRGAAAEQAELVQAIVAGEPVDHRDAAATLRHDVDGRQLAFIVWTEPGARIGASVAPTTIARELAGELGGTQTLIVPVGERVAWAWTTGDRLDARAAPRRPSALGGRARAALGAVHPGVAGMCRSHREARAAREVGETFGVRAGTLIGYPSVALTSLVSAEPGRAAEFVVAELGELGADTDAMARLRATIRVYLDERLSPARTARRLGIHQNTVVYRAKRAEELLGRSLDDRRLELEIALRLHDGLDGLRGAATAAG